MDATFRSKVDLGFVGILVGVPLTLFLIIVSATGLQRSWLFPYALAGVLAVWLICFWIGRNTVYTLTDDALIVRSGPFFWRVAFADVREISPSRDSRFSPALSLDRLCLKYGKGRYLLISPADQAGFLSEYYKRKTAR